MTSIVAAANASEQAIFSTVTPWSPPSGTGNGEASFLSVIRHRFGLTDTDWDRIKKAIKITKDQNALPDEEDGLGRVTPMVFIGSLFKSVEDYFAVIGLALDMGKLIVADLPETILVDDADSRIVMSGVAVPAGQRADGRTAWDTSRLRAVISSKMDPGSREVECGVRKSSSGDYLLIDFTPIQRELPNLSAKLERNGLFLRPDLKPFSKATRTALAHRLTLAAGGVNVAGLEGDHLAFSTGAWYGGPSTFDARFQVMQALTKDAHTAKTIARGERHYYTEMQRKVVSDSTSRLAQGAAEAEAILLEVFEEGLRLEAERGRQKVGQEPREDSENPAREDGRGPAEGKQRVGLTVAPRWMLGLAAEVLPGGRGAGRPGVSRDTHWGVGNAVFAGFSPDLIHLFHTPIFHT